MSEVGYSIDTSALIHAWVRSYPIHNFPSFWNRIDDLIEADRLCASIEVLNEIKKRNDGLFKWANERLSIFIDIEGDDLQIQVAGILHRYPRLVDTRKNRSAADPFVIAVASLDDPPLVVVTQEGATNNIKKPNIPDICAEEGLDCISIVDLIVRQDWRF